MPLASGTQLGPYEIRAPLGSGGMAAVYRARDIRLGRDVALKVLPEEFANDPDRISRFRREAQLLASLNHPHIAQIYEFEEYSSVLCIVMEVVEGPTLQERLERGPLPVEEALQIAKQIADALEAAHKKGIVHRDLKPANVKLTTDGQVKVLDFGLAKPLAVGEAADNLTNSPTMLSGPMPGVILGTVPYMSPEQARGKFVDQQTDIWSFGCVMYEMLAGKRAFAGETVTDVLSAIINLDPDWTALPESTPSVLRLLLRRSLNKDPKHRLHEAADMRIMIEESDDESAPAVSSRTTRRSVALIALLAVALAIASTLIALYLRNVPAEAPEMRLEISLPPDTDQGSMTISPDGRRVAFVKSSEGRGQIWIRPLNSLTAQMLQGTEGAMFPFWSADSRSVGFFADGKLKRVGISGGPPQILAASPVPRGGSWSHDDTIVFAPTTGPLYRIPAAGGEPTPITRLEAGQFSHRFPKFLSDDRHFLYFVVGNAGASGIYVGSVDGAPSTHLLDADANAVYLPSGFLLFVRQATLFAQRFEVAKLKLTGDPFPIASPIFFERDSYAAAVSAAINGTILYRTGPGVGFRRLVWFDRSGKEQGSVGTPDLGFPQNPQLSPDGTRVALWRTSEGNVDVWLIETLRGIPTRFTTDAANDNVPVWSPDGSRIVFSSNRNGAYDLYMKPSAGRVAEVLLKESKDSKHPTDWSSDGRFILYRELTQKSGEDLWALPLTGNKEPVAIAVTDFEELAGQFSPDDHWVAYQSNESGQPEIYVQSFPESHGPVALTTGGGIQPRWRHDGKELFYLTTDGKLMAVPMVFSADSSTFKPGTPVPLFPTRITSDANLTRTGQQQYAVTADGQRFLLVVPEETSASVNVILNWGAGSRQK